SASARDVVPSRRWPLKLNQEDGGKTASTDLVGNVPLCLVNAKIPELLRKLSITHMRLGWKITAASTMARSLTAPWASHSLTRKAPHGAAIAKGKTITAAPQAARSV